MQRVGIIIVALAAIAFGQLVAAQPTGQQRGALNIVTAGDQNMVDYVKDYLGPMFEKEHPGVTVRAVGTGPGDAGSQKIYEKLEAEKNNSAWDIDVAVIHQKAAGEMVGKGLLARYVAEVPTAKLVTSEAAKRALGADVDGYVMPMFNSQTAIAYNTTIVKDPPSTYAELEKWVEQNPKKFGYNGIKGGMSGVSFIVGWVYAHTPDADRLIKGPYDPDSKKGWDQALARLAAFNKNVVLTPGNAGTLDMLNRGEIAMGPVWVDMFYTWQADGKIPPTVKLKLIGPGMPGQPMYYVVPAKARTPSSRRSLSRWRRAPKYRLTALSNASIGILGSMPLRSSRSSTRRHGRNYLSMSRRRTSRPKASLSRSRLISTTSWK